MQQPKVIIDTPPAPIVKTFKQQLLGPWTANDPKVHQLIVRTQPTAGLAQRRFQSTYPTAPTIKQGATAITGGFQFVFNVVSGPNVAGYNIYRTTVNNPAVGTLIQYQAQPPIVQPLQSITVQDITTATPYYWVASVNSAGKESARISAMGSPSPVPNPTKPLPSGGASGMGAGGGRGGGVIRSKMVGT